MLEMRPNCEACDRDLDPSGNEATICSFECTFCSDCATQMSMRCPNCAGVLVPRPARSAELLERFPASTTRVVKEAT